MAKYNEERAKKESAGKSKTNAANAAQALAKKLPEFTAVQKWLDNEAEIKLKRVLEQIMTKLEEPTFN